MFDAIREVNAAGTAVLLRRTECDNGTGTRPGGPILLEEGRMIAEGTPATLFANPELRRAYLGVGAEG